MLSNASDPMGGKTASGLASSLSVRSGSLLCTRQHTHPSGLENAPAVPPYSSVHVYRWRRAREDDMLLMWSIYYIAVQGCKFDRSLCPSTCRLSVVAVLARRERRWLL